MLFCGKEERRIKRQDTQNTTLIGNKTPDSFILQNASSLGDAMVRGGYDLCRGAG